MGKVAGRDILSSICLSQREAQILSTTCYGVTYVGIEKGGYNGGLLKLALWGKKKAQFA